MANPTTEVSLTSTTRGAQGFGSTGIATLLTTAIVSTLKATQFHQEFLNQVRTASLADPEYQDWVSHPDPKTERVIQDGLIYFRNRLYIPENEPLRLQIAESEHDSQVAGHFGQKKTLELITRNFYWPNMEGWVNQYVRSCDDCQRNKSPRHARYGLLQPLDLAPAPWVSTSVDFITALPESDEHTQVMVVVDRFTKMAHFVALKENATATDCARAFLREIWRTHGLPTDLVSDRDTKWTGEFWDGLCQQLGIKKKLSTAFHPQTDGQTERVNQTLETYLRTFVNYDQNDWYQLLPLAEFAYNNSSTTATKMTPFYANYGYHPRTIWPSDQDIKNPASKIYAHWMKDIHQKAKEALESTRASMNKYYDQHRLPQPEFEVGDQVMLNAKNIRTKRPTKKLAPKLYGPFRVLAKIGSRSYRLELQERWRIHNVFHASLLEPHRANPFQQRPVSRPLPEEVDGGLEYEVEAILQSEIRTSRRRQGNRYRNIRTLYFLVKWKGYPEDECTWEPGSSLNSIPDLVEHFYQLHPDAPKL
jgi:transposase InsO family protein